MLGLPPAHGGSQYALAEAIEVPPQQVLAIVHRRTGDDARRPLRLGRYFAVEPQLWLNPQTRHDLDRADAALGDRLDEEVTPCAA